jgi:lysyl-tRNA synthetase class 2
MLTGMAKHSKELISSSLSSLAGHTVQFNAPFKRIDFILGIEAAMNEQLPNLTSPDAESRLAELIRAHSLSLPTVTTLPQMLDLLSTTYLEPQCDEPTFIINQPECLSPLAKSFDHPRTKQRVSARAELFVQGQEIANMYEEENSPFEQRRKFVTQLQYQPDSEGAVIDENYLEALEWGLPPTGGFGCGVDRLCMIFAGVNRIADVLTFGTLRNVVSLKRGQTTL